MAKKKLKVPEVLVIDRSIWLHGEDSGQSFLLRPSDGKMCCLGIYLHACGLPKKELSNVKMPSKLPNKIQKNIPEWLISIHDFSQGVDEASEINDTTLCEGMTAKTRERKLQKIFREHGTKVIFQGKSK